MSFECPSCGVYLDNGKTECGCGWNIPPRLRPHAASNDQPRAPHVGFFHTSEQLHEHERHQAGLAENMRRRLADRHGELAGVPRHRQWAKKILIRHEEGDPRVTPAMLDMAKAAMGVALDQEAA